MFPKKILTVVNKRKTEAASAVAALKDWATAHRIPQWTISLAEALPVEPGEGFLAISLGGDGTFLRTAKLVAEYETPVLGINVGSLGFLTQTNSQELLSALDQVLAGEYTVDERLRLEVECDSSRTSALNDVVLTRADINDFTKIDLYWGQNRIGHYPGDGVIVATPSGSTAYSLAARGPIVYPTLECMLITPLNVHALALRPLVLPAHAELRAEMRLPGWLVVDGVKIAQLKPKSSVLIRRFAHSTRLVVLRKRPGFFDLMVEKLGWSGRA